MGDIGMSYTPTLRSTSGSTTIMADAPSPVSRLTSVLSALEVRVDHARQELDALESRLSGLRVEMPRTKENGLSAPVESHGAVLNAVMEQAERIANLAARLAAINADLVV